MHHIVPAFLVAILLGLASAPPSSSGRNLPVDEAVLLRAEYGLNDDPSYVRDLMFSARDVGTGRWGIPMTANEDRALDLASRMEFADYVEQTLLPSLRAEPAFGGIYYDQADGGRLAIQLAGGGQYLGDTIATALSGAEYPWSVEAVKYSEAELVSAASELRALWPADVRVEIGIDTRHNRVFVGVPDSVRNQALTVFASMNLMNPVPVAIIVAHEEIDAHCTLSRDHCADPMKAGIKIFHFVSLYDTVGCTMGFHISRNGNEQFVTSGHCGWTGEAYWRHDGLSPNTIGTVQQTLLTEGGQDIMRVEMNADSQASDDVYDDSANIVGSGAPSQGETLCTSLGQSDSVKCGNVTTTWVSYTSSTCGCTVWGGDMSYTTILGDSGSPVYRRLPGGTGDDARAIGANANTGGKFARLDQSLDDFGAIVYSYP